MISAYAAKSKSSHLSPFQFELGPLDSNELLIDITHCGICHSDIHLLDNDWDMTTYPFVPGHEIIGTVSNMGSRVTGFKLGDRVGVGWQRSACFDCEFCQKGEEHYCSKGEDTCVNHYGGYASAIQVDHRFAFLIPETLPSAETAPLLCGGITVFSPLINFQIQPGMKIGVLGMGGLGHLAIQFAAKMGCVVTALSSSPDKQEDSFAFGAKNFILTSDKRQMKANKESFDFLLSTVNADLDWSSIMDLVKFNGRLCFVGAPQKALSLPIYKLIHGQRSICGSPIGSPSMIRKMLAFAADHHVKAQVERVPLQDVNTAIQSVRQNKARYRKVLEIK